MHKKLPTEKSWWKAFVLLFKTSRYYYTDEVIVEYKIMGGKYYVIDRIFLEKETPTS